MSRAVAVVVALALVATGCGGGGDSAKSDPDAARAAVTDFAKAFGAGDGKRACALLTSAGRTAFLKRVKVLTSTSDCPTAIKRVHDAAGGQVTQAFAQAKVSAVTVKGSSASAQLTATGHSTDVALAKEGGSWKLTSVPGL
jgi:ketosteroid isomerase-like protein